MSDCKITAARCPAGHLGCWKDACWSANPSAGGPGDLPTPQAPAARLSVPAVAPAAAGLREAAQRVVRAFDAWGEPGGSIQFGGAITALRAALAAVSDLRPHCPCGWPLPADPAVMDMAPAGLSPLLLYTCPGCGGRCMVDVTPDMVRRSLVDGPLHERLHGVGQRPAGPVHETVAVDEAFDRGDHLSQKAGGVGRESAIGAEGELAQPSGKGPEAIVLPADSGIEGAEAGQAAAHAYIDTARGDLDNPPSPLSYEELEEERDRIATDLYKAQETLAAVAVPDGGLRAALSALADEWDHMARHALRDHIVAIACTEHAAALRAVLETTAHSVAVSPTHPHK